MTKFCAIYYEVYQISQNTINNSNFHYKKIRRRQVKKKMHMESSSKAFPQKVLVDFIESPP